MSHKKPKEPMIACPTCGTANRIASPFCADCGGRIYQNGSSPSPENSIASERSSASKAFRSSINALLFLAVVTIFGLAFWPYASLTVPVVNESPQLVERYLEIVESAIENENTLPTARFPQRNLNAYLGQNSLPDDNKLMGIVFSARELELIANEPVGPLNLSTRVVLKPSADATHLEVSNFWVGHLPLPSFWAKPWSQSVAKRFDLNVDRNIWDHLKLVKIEAANLHVEFQP